MPRSSPGVLASNALTARWVELVGVDREDFTVSGAVVWPLLAALAAGAEGAARGELEQAVGLPVDRALAAAVDVVGVIDHAVAAHGAMGLWVRENVPLRMAWASALPAHTRGRLGGATDQDQAALNAWVKEHTLGIVDSLPVRIDGKTLLLLAACLAIRTRWHMPFEDSAFPRSSESGPWAGRLLHELCLMLGLRPPPQYTVRVIRVTFDRPFGFLAVDRLSRLVLFAGWVENPARHPHAEFYKAMTQKRLSALRTRRY